MTEHVHEWQPGGDYDDCYFTCECGTEIEGGEVLRRLNATDKLSAQYARMIGARLRTERKGHGDDEHQQTLRAYAAARESVPNQEGDKDEREDFSLPSGLLGGL